MTNESTTGPFVMEVFLEYGDAYYEGRHSADDLLHLGQCPYPANDPHSLAWMAGWLRQNELMAERGAKPKSL